MIYRRRTHQWGAPGNSLVSTVVGTPPPDAQTGTQSRASNGGLRLAAARRENQQRPAVHLANETLMEIFEMACEMGPGFIRDTHSSMVSVRNSICGTCSSWRSVAIKDTALWNTIAVQDLNNYAIQITTIKRIIIELARAGGRPLELHVWQHVRVLYPILPNILEMFRAAGRHCRSIRFHVSATLRDSLLFLRTPRISDSLRYLKLDPTEGPRYAQTNQRGPGGEYEHEEIVDLAHLSNLTHTWITFGGTHDDYGVRLIINPPTLSKITHLHLRGNIDPFSCLLLINTSYYLENLSWKDQRRIDVRQLSGGRIELHPFLREVSLQGGFPVSFARDMECPNLERLRLNGHDRCGFVRSIWAARDHPLSSDSRYPKLTSLQVSGYATTDSIGPFLLAHARLRLDRVVLQGVFDEYLANCLYAALPSLRCLDVPGLGSNQIKYVEEILRRRAGCKPAPSQLLTLGLHDDLTDNNHYNELGRLKTEYAHVAELVFGDFIEQSWAWGRLD